MKSYDEIAAINWSTLKHMAVSPLMYKWRLEHPEPQKPAFVIGGAIHTAILEPDKFAERYAVCDLTRDKRHKAYQEWLAEHPGVIPLRTRELERVQAIASAVHEDPNAGPLVVGGRREEAVTWTDEVTGLACKGRLDWIRPDVVVDLKTTHDPTPRKFERTCCDFGYAAQLAFYHDGATARRLIDGKRRPYIVAPKKSAPHEVVVFQLKPETLEYGRAMYRTLLQRLVECTEADYWPGMAPQIVELGLPKYLPDDQMFGIETDDEEDF